MIYECEQCNGTGYLEIEMQVDRKSGFMKRQRERCPCREEDDAALERRKQMRAVSSNRDKITTA